MTPDQIVNAIVISFAILAALVVGVGGLIVVVIQQRTKIEKEAIHSRQEIALAAKEATAALPAAVGQQVGDQLKTQFANFFDFYTVKSDEFNRAVAAIRLELDQVKADRTNLLSKLADIQIQFTEARTKAEDAAKRATDAEARLKVLERAGLDKDQQLLNANATITSLKNELGTAKDELETTKTSMGVLSQRVTVLEEQSKVMIAERATIIAERDALQAANAAIIAERDSAVAERDTARAELVTLRGELDAVKLELAALKLMVTPLPADPVIAPEVPQP